jgi:hypothetical protein
MQKSSYITPWPNYFQLWLKYLASHHIEGETDKDIDIENIINDLYILPLVFKCDNIYYQATSMILT